MQGVHSRLTASRHRTAVWLARLLPLAAAILLAAALAVSKPTVHGFLVGAALGLLIGYCVYSFQIDSVTLKDTPQPSDVIPQRITE